MDVFKGNFYYKKFALIEKKNKKMSTVANFVSYKL